MGILVVASLQSAQAVPFISKQLTETTTATLTSTDIAVIEAISKKSAWSLWRKKGTFIAVVVECDPGEVKYTPFSISPGFPTLETTNTLVLDFDERNRKAFRLKKLIRRPEVAIIGNKTWELMVARRDYKIEFPDYIGNLYFWLPGYNEDQTEALVFAFDWVGDVHFHEIRLKKEGDEWIKTYWEWMLHITLQ